MTNSPNDGKTPVDQTGSSQPGNGTSGNEHIRGLRRAAYGGTNFEDEEEEEECPF